jgi:AcrR family transcriptional regulator
MFLPESPAWVDIATDFGIPLIAEGGLGAVTPAAIARPARCSRQAVHQRLGSAEALRRSVAARFLGRWERWLDVRVQQYGVDGLLPDSDDALAWARVWLALGAHAVLDTELAAWVVGIHQTERSLVRSALTRKWADELGMSSEFSEDVVATVHAVVGGIRVDRCHHGSSFEEACAVLDAALRLVGQGYLSAVA